MTPRVGIGFREPIAIEIAEHHREFQVLEVLTDGLLGERHQRARESALKLGRVFPLIPHGVNLSIGEVGCLRRRSYLRALKSFISEVGASYYSDHFALTHVDGRDLGHLSPLWRSEAQLTVVSSNVKKVQRLLGRRLVLENITQHFVIPGSMSEPEFLNRVVRATDCGLLVDLANVFINSRNLGFEAMAFLGSLELGAIRQVHLAGGHLDHGTWVDSHSTRVPGPVWDLLSWLAPRAPHLEAVIIERDTAFDDFDELVQDARVARKIMRRAMQ